MFLFNINVYLNEECLSSSVLLLWFDIQSTMLGQTKLNVYTIDERTMLVCKACLYENKTDGGGGGGSLRKDGNLSA